MTATLHIVGGGMAGSEAAWQAAQMGVPVVIHEMRPKVATFAHRTGDLAEMVCSNSFRSDDHERNAVYEAHSIGEHMPAAASELYLNLVDYCSHYLFLLYLGLI